MPVMSLKLDRRYNGQQCISEYHYVASGVPSTVSLSFALASAFGVIESLGTYDPATPFGSLLAWQVAGVSYVETVAKDLYSVTDFYTNPFISGLTGLGGGAGASESPFIAAGFRTNRIRSDIRRGFKRYEGITDANVGSYGEFASPFLAALVAHATYISDTLTYDDEGNTLTFVPCVISLKKNLTDLDQGKYIKWPTEAEQLEHLASGVVYTADAFATTQNSRKVGRGS